MTSDEAQTVIAFLLAAVLAQSALESYRAVFVRAAPGALTELVDLVKARRSLATEELRPLLLRHAQGDQWDLMILQPIGTLSAYFGTDRSATDPSWDRLVAWQEELFVVGPPRLALLAAMLGAGYFHLEIFQALAGKRDSLTAERRMENAFLGATGRPTNLIFIRVAGASWDQFSLGFYRDLQHYAEPTRVSAEREEAAAREAGFDSRSGIGPYLRRFINGHHDTLGSVVP